MPSQFLTVDGIFLAFSYDIQAGFYSLQRMSSE